MSEDGALATNEARSVGGPAPGRMRTSLRTVAIALLVAALVALGRMAGDRLPEFAAWVEGLGWWGPLVFATAYVVATISFVPGSLLTLAGGAIFGVIEGTLLVFLAASVGASLAFLVSRHLVRSAIEQRFAGNERFASIDRAVAREGRKIVLLLRLSPVFPFNLLNYALGLTKVGFLDYAIACVGMLPGTLLYVYYGALAGEVVAIAGGAGVEKGTGYYVVLAIGLVATIAVTTYVTRTARRALREVAGE